MNDWTQYEYLEWYKQYFEDDWKSYAKAAEEAKLKFREYSILYTMSKMSTSNRAPSFSQLKWAKRIVDTLEVHMDKQEFEDSFESANDSKKSGHKHLTVRMAWHDNLWNGSLCEDPVSNIYCNGFNSLLSERIRKRKKSEIEDKYKCRPIQEIIEKEKYTPPCYWSINAFGETNIHIEHDNPANSRINSIQDTILNNSVYSWPFKLSFVRDNKARKIEGKYPANLENIRIPHFQNKFKEKSSVVFLYANFDNPISGDDNISGIRPAYLLVGCAMLNKKGEPTFFSEPQNEFEKARKKPDLQNFPNINWAIQYSLDPETIVRLPYHEYLEKRDTLKTKEERDVFDVEKMSKLKVTITEPELIHCFKYVAMDIDDDEAIYLLSKIRFSLYSIKDHGLISTDEIYVKINRVDSILQTVWNKRGYFPGFEKLCRIILNRNNDEDLKLDGLIAEIKQKEVDNSYVKLIEILENPDSDDHYKRFANELWGIKEYLEEIMELEIKSFLKLAMLNLTRFQFERILDSKIMLENNCFDISTIANNPYVLYEDYESKIDYEDPNTGDQLDNPIELFKIDIAYFPDIRFIDRITLQRDLKHVDKRRIRALIIQHLKELENIGHCFDDSTNIQDALKLYPLFYKIDNEYELPNNLLRDMKEDFENHLKAKLHIEQVSDNNIFYLNIVYNAERNIATVLSKQLAKEDIEFNTEFFKEYIAESSQNLAKKLQKNFDEETFISERNFLFDWIFTKPFFVLAGSPGSGKSFELLKFITTITEQKEDYILLAPTGKAVLRLKTEPGFEKIKAMTIDKFLHDCKNNNKNIGNVNNLIIDEMSMVDLLKLDELFSQFNFDKPSFKRIIFVGDQYQLPPIGYGKVFIDTINYLKSEPKYTDKFIELQSNCRQKLDREILDFSKIFSNQNKDYEDLLLKINSTKQVSNHFHIYYWKNHEELYSQIENRLFELGDSSSDSTNQILNQLFNLKPNGDIKSKEPYNCDGLQLLTPYRTNHYGTIRLNHLFQNVFRRTETYLNKGNLAFKHSDKIYQTKNKYDFETKEIALSNGSIGIVQKEKQFYFSEFGNKSVPNKLLNSEELDLAYCLTVHKSQGSGFDNVFLIIPEKITLLSRELIYTALTRSKESLTIFIEGEPSENLDKSLFYKLRTRSYTETRKTSLFKLNYWGFSLEPDNGVFVRSRVEYIIYKLLQEESNKSKDFSFEYEKQPEKNGKKLQIKTDFTIFANNKIYYWEHLGLLGDRYYEDTWKFKRKKYKEFGIEGQLITTDEKYGISNEKIISIIKAIRENDIKNEDKYLKFSEHHYSLR